MGLLRFILAMGVALGHSRIFPGTYFPGDTAVQGFYALSGFYMALVLNERFIPGARGYALFLANRYVRLLPVYLLILVLTLTLALIVPLDFTTEWKRSMDVASRLYLGFTALFIVGQDATIFLQLKQGALVFAANALPSGDFATAFMPIPQAWTLGVELSFYALAPFFVRRKPAVVIGAIFASLALRLGLQAAFGYSGDPWSYRFFPSELALFLTGAFAYRVFRDDSAANRGWLTAVALSVGAALLINRWNGATRVVSVGALMMILAGIPWLARATITSRADRYLGELSYPIYTCHIFVLWLVDVWMKPSGLIRDALFIAITLLLSLACYQLIDRPVAAWRHRRLTHEGTGKGAESMRSIRVNKGWW